MARFGRLRLKKDGKPRLVLGVHPVPTMVTLGNLLCGFGAIVLAMRAENPPSDFYNFNAHDCLRVSGMLIFAAMVFDVLDGKVARWTKSTSKFGMEMDSLCDVVSFGVAPAVLVKAMIDLQLKTEHPFPMLDRFVWPMLAAYVCCAALRLARYNVEAETGHRDFFFGMPSPGAAGCVASLCILIIPSDHARVVGPIQQIQQMAAMDSWLEASRRDVFFPVLVAMPFLMLLLAILMVTRVHYPHVGDRLLRGKKSFMHLMILGLALVLTAMLHEIMLAVAFNGYMLFGLVNELRYQFVPSQRPKEWDVEARPPEPPQAAAASAAPPVAPAAPGAPAAPPAPPTDAQS
ncbi:MAG TPA: CDP-alcohol phosphatidyltransferase family protein [Planctomycetota bacterium]|nr:CDP-alcohol phosphatidyltransferase family protein [Planctomycetota bacterium]